MLAIRSVTVPSGGAHTSGTGSEGSGHIPDGIYLAIRVNVESSGEPQAPVSGAESSDTTAGGGHPDPRPPRTTIEPQLASQSRFLRGSDHAEDVAGAESADVTMTTWDGRLIKLEELHISAASLAGMLTAQVSVVMGAGGEVTLEEVLSSLRLLLREGDRVESSWFPGSSSIQLMVEVGTGVVEGILNHMGEMVARSRRQSGAGDAVTSVTEGRTVLRAQDVHVSSQDLLRLFQARVSSRLHSGDIFTAQEVVVDMRAMTGPGETVSTDHSPGTYPLQMMVEEGTGNVHSVIDHSGRTVTRNDD